MSFSFVKQIKIVTATLLFVACGPAVKNQPNQQNQQETNLQGLKIQHVRTDGTNPLTLSVWENDDSCVISNLGDVYCIPGDPIGDDGKVEGYDGTIVPCILETGGAIGSCEKLIDEDDDDISPCPLRVGEYNCDPKPNPCVCDTESLRPCPLYYPIYCSQEGDGDGGLPPPLVL